MLSCLTSWTYLPTILVKRRMLVSEAQLSHSQAVGPWASHSTSLFFSFLLSKMGVIAIEWLSED